MNMELKLHSPVGYSPAVYRWPLVNKKGYDVAHELIQTMKWACHDIPDLEIPLKRNILKDYDTSDYVSMKKLCNKFNRAIDSVLSLEKGTQKFCDRLNQVACKELLHHILQQTYSSSVDNAEQLNKYEAFSPDVYGETSFDLVDKIIKKVKFTKNDIFIDLGSGVGQVVLQVAATTPCKMTIGIEKAKVPSSYAETMRDKFNFWMNWYGKKCGKYELYKGDFLDEIFRKKINNSTIVFINNYAFGPALDHKLKERFAEFKDGTKIISCKTYCPINFRISERNLSDVATIINLKQVDPIQGSVSWTSKPMSFYIQVIDRTKLEKYFQWKQQQKLEGRSETSSDASNDVSEEEYVPTSQALIRKTTKRSISKVRAIENISQPKSLDSLLDIFKIQYTQMVEDMKNPLFKMNVEKQIRDELVKKDLLLQKSKKLEYEIEAIILEMQQHVR